jgi:hypothetical protein
MAFDSSKKGAKNNENPPRFPGGTYQTKTLQNSMENFNRQNPTHPQNFQRFKI